MIVGGAIATLPAYITNSGPTIATLPAYITNSGPTYLFSAF